MTRDISMVCQPFTGEVSVTHLINKSANITGPELPSCVWVTILGSTPTLGLGMPGPGTMLPQSFRALKLEHLQRLSLQAWTFTLRFLHLFLITLCTHITAQASMPLDQSAGLQLTRFEITNVGHIDVSVSGKLVMSCFKIYKYFYGRSGTFGLDPG